MKMLIFTSLLTVFASIEAHAFEATITKVGSVKPNPVASVSKVDLPPIEGVAVAEPRSAAVYKPEVGGHVPFPKIGRIPVPTPRPLATLACLIVWPD